MEEDEVSKRTHSQTQVDYHTSQEARRLSCTHVPVQAVSSNQQLHYCILTFGGPLQQATALQFSLQVTHTSQIHQVSTLLFHFITFKKK